MSVWSEAGWIKKSVDNVDENLTSMRTVGFVKSVQRGTVESVSHTTGTPGNKTIQLEPINPNKSIVLFNGGEYSDGSEHDLSWGYPQVVSLTESTLVVRRPYYWSSSSNTQSFYNGPSFGWQIIEFY